MPTADDDIEIVAQAGFVPGSRAYAKAPSQENPAADDDDDEPGPTCASYGVLAFFVIALVAIVTVSSNTAPLPALFRAGAAREAERQARRRPSCTTRGRLRREGG